MLPKITTKLFVSPLQYDKNLKNLTFARREDHGGTLPFLLYTVAEISVGDLWFPYPRRCVLSLSGNKASSCVTILMVGTLTAARGETQRIYTYQCCEGVFPAESAKAVPVVYIDKPRKEAFYLPMHAVFKESRTMTQLHIVFLILCTCIQQIHLLNSRIDCIYRIRAEFCVTSSFSYV